MRILVSGGGTGGHIYPLLAVLEALETMEGLVLETLYLGSQEGLEAQIIPRCGVRFQAISTAKIVGSRIWQMPGQVARMIAGTMQSRRIIREFRPQAILASGGYVSVPGVLAGWMQRIPTLLYLPDLEPGLAVRFLAPFARRIAVSFPDTERFFAKGKTVTTGYPVRSRIGTMSKAEARRRLQLPAEESVTLVLGGSRGARAINLALAENIVPILELTNTLHISGEPDYSWLQKFSSGLPARAARRYWLYPYLYEEMPTALAAADLALTRAGASVLGEFPAAGLPSILVPYPYARRHQEKNAEYLAGHGAGLLINEEELPEKLLPTLKAILSDRVRQEKMAEAARRLSQPQAAEKLAQVFVQMITVRS